MTTIDPSEGFEGLRATVLGLLENSYPDLPIDLVDTILDVERRHEEERDQAVRAVARAIEGAAAAEHESETP